MRISTTAFLSDETIQPAALARELEQRGFAGLYLPEHTHIPVSRQTPAPTGEPLPRVYGRTIDPLVGLTAAATVTDRLALGTAVSLVAQHDPIVLAKQVATLDWLSDGRLTLGVGLGWNVEEAADHGVEWSTRRSLVRDRIALMRALWAPEPTAYEGGFGSSVAASWAYPKPVRPTGPRLLLGGAASSRLFAHVGAYADGWMPIGGGGLTDALPRLREAAPGAEVVPSYVNPSPGKLARFAELGIEEVILALPDASEPEVLRALDDFAQYL